MNTQREHKNQNKNPSQTAAHSPLNKLGSYGLEGNKSSNMEHLLIDILINTSKRFPKSKVKTILGGQAVNRLERVNNRLKNYRKSGNTPTSEVMAVAVLAVLDEDTYMPEFLRMMPEKIPYQKRKVNP